MGWFKELFSGKPCGTGGDDPKVKALSVTPEALYYDLVILLQDKPNHVIELDTEYAFTDSTFVFNHKLWVHMVNSELHYFVTDQGLTGLEDKVLTEKNILKVITNNEKREDLYRGLYNINWEGRVLDLDTIPNRTHELVTNALTSAAPFTALPVFNGIYAVTNHPEQGYAIYSKSNGLEFKLSYWITDLALHLEHIKLPNDPNDYLITDELQVDIQLLPDTHWRKWVRVEPAVDNANATMKYVPRDIARGKVQYFDITFDFNEPRLAGLAFAPGSLLKQAVDSKIIQLNKAIPWDECAWDEFGNHRVVNKKSDTYLKPERIKVRWDSRTYLLEDYLELERQSATNLERPYLAPNQKEVDIDGNKFSIDADYYINYTPWEPKK